jgi:hypothetical protein
MDIPGLARKYVSVLMRGEVAMTEAAITIIQEAGDGLH